MQFTQVQQAESFKQDYQQTCLQFYMHELQHFQTYKSQEYKTILNDIQSINHARSLVKGIEEEHENQVIAINERDLEVEEPDFVFIPAASMPNFIRKSNIFNSKKSAEGSESTLLTFQSKTIKVFYMCTPIHKFIQYTSTTTAQSLISKALNLYSKDLSLDQKILQFTDPKSNHLIDIEYELRFPIEEGDYLPDFQVDAVHKDRLIFDGFFSAFILVLKNSNNLKQNSQKMDVQEKTGKMRLNIFNEANMQVTSLILSKEDTLQKVINYLQAELKQKITLTEQLEDDLSLPSDLDIKNLGTCKIYAKKKRFLDEPQKEKIPLKIISSIPRDLSTNILAPIGISQASRYEEFEVTKVNSRGVRQQRIIGFDQTKMYNYESSVRKKNKQPSLLKIILGGNTLTGTKKPETLISEIKGINSLQGHSFQILFHDKKTVFMTETEDKKQKIMRKIKFLIDFNQKNTKI